MYKFEAGVRFLRSGWRLAYIGLPVALAWFFILPSVTTWCYIDCIYITWFMKYQWLNGEMAQHLGWGVLISVGCTILSAAVAFCFWVFWSMSADLSFTRSSVATLAIGFLLIGCCPTIAFYLFIYNVIPGALGVALVMLETKRMAVLANTY